MKKVSKALALLAALMMIAALPAPAKAETLPTAVREMATLPGNWSPLSDRTEEKQFLLSLTTAPFYRATPGGMQPVLAAALPEDVTEQYAGDVRFGVPANAVRGYAFTVTLSESACWEDGTPITADDLIFTAEAMLTAGKMSELPALSNLWEFVLGEQRRTGEVVSLCDAGFGSIREAQDAGISEFFIDTSAYWGLAVGWQNIHNRARLLDDAVASGCAERYVTPAYLFRNYLDAGTEYAYFQSEFVGIRTEKAEGYTMSSVGILRTGEQQITLILAQPSAPSALAVVLSQLAVLPRSRFGDGYGTAPTSFLSYGPYRIVSAGTQEIVLEPNENWWGSAADLPYGRIICRCA